jgi:hypothetical protein
MSAGTVTMELTDATGAFVADAMITTSPASTYRYGNPPAGKTMSMTDGIASALNAPVGAMSLMATKTGATFKTHSVNVRANAFTTTIVTE